MPKNKNIKSIIVNIILIFLLIVLVYKSYKPKIIDEGFYNYCIAWEGGIDRTELVWKCYNFKKQKILCDFEITDTDTLIFFERGNSSNVHSTHRCKRYIKSQSVLFFDDVILNG